MRRLQDKLVDLTVDRWLAETPKAWLVIINGVRAWIPKQNAEFYESDGIVSMPEWMAIEKELV